jgi:hypothetical protein
MITNKRFLAQKYAYGVSLAINMFITLRFGLDPVLLQKEFGRLKIIKRSLMYWEELQLMKA